MSAAMIGFVLGGIFCGVPMMLIAATLALEAAEHRKIYEDGKAEK